MARTRALQQALAPIFGGGPYGYGVPVGPVPGGPG